MKFYDLDFFGLKRKLPISYISPKYMIANFNILGDIELTSLAAKKLDAVLKKRKITPDCFVGPEVKVVPLIIQMAIANSHKRYVILRKSIRGYMVSPTVEYPNKLDPAHTKKLVISSQDKVFLLKKNSKVVLLDDVVSTGATMELSYRLMKKSGVEVLARLAIFKQGDSYSGDLIYLAKLPIINVVNTP